MKDQKQFSDPTEDDVIALSETGDWVSVGDLSERKALWKDRAGRMIDGKRQRISISIPERDLARLKAKALEEGMPYQTLINSILHKYVS